MIPVYLDYNATTPVDPIVSNAMMPYLNHHFGNPSSSHFYGTETKKAIEKAREDIARMLNANADEIVFTSGGTESDNMAVKGIAFARKSSGNHILISSVEHPAVTEVCKWLKKFDFRITLIPVDQSGIVDPDFIRKAITGDTILISVMHANNETGSIQPIREIGSIAMEHGIVFHTDAAQSAGKIKVDVKGLNVDLLTLAGHKMYAPKGIGVLYIRRGVKPEKLIHGADHEANRRAGTENVSQIVGLGTAASLIEFDQNSALILREGQESPSKLTSVLFDLLKNGIPEIRLNGHPIKRLPNTLSIGFPGVDATRLLHAMPGIAASAGAACHSDRQEISPVLTAMQVPGEYAIGTIRFSVGRITTMQEVEEASEIIIHAYKKNRHTAKIFPVEIPDISGIKLTRYTHALGCACKIRPQYLERILRGLPVSRQKEVMVGFEHCDDAAVYAISPEQAIVQTVDIIPPVVDDPRIFGAIAAANSISDIYAMGGKPLFALSIVGFPDRELPETVLAEILKGAHAKAAEAGIEIIGGHTIEDGEPKFGLAVTGIIHPQKITRNSGAKPGDAIIMTKPLGTGIIMTALKQGFAQTEEVIPAMEIMMELNKTAAEVIAGFGVSSCTDVTGFGLLGHLKEMITASGVRAVIFSKSVQVLQGTARFATMGIIPGGTGNNLDFVIPMVKWGENIPDFQKFILADAQTSGGLLFTLPGSEAENCIGKLRERGVAAATLIGQIVEGDPLISVL